MGKNFLYLGEEEFLKKEAIEKLRDTYGKETAYYSFSPQEESFNIQEVMRIACTANLFSPHQIIVIKDIEKISIVDRETLLSYLRNPVHSTDLILLTRLKMKKLNNPDYRWLNNLLKETNLKSQEFFSLSEEELKRWIVNRVNMCGKNISNPALKLLITKLGKNLFLLSQAIEKASLYVKEKKIIEWADLEQIVGREISLDAYKMLNALLKGNLGEGIRILRDMQEFNVKIDRILGAVAAELRKFYQAKKLLGRGFSQFQIKKELNLFYTDTFFLNLGKITQEKLKKSLRRLISIDYAIKRGKTKPFFALESWLLEAFS